MNDVTGSTAWAARMVLQWAGAALAARGYGDEALWQAIGGALMTAGGAAWSWRARKAQKREVPADVLADMEARLRAVVGR